jgi:thioredoxin-dependent peroxiredoxin
MANAELKIGDKAPVFALKNAAGEIVKLADFNGKTVVLFFYPKDDTPG